MTILEKIKFEEDWLSEVNLTKENIKIAFAGIRATALEQQPCEDCVSRDALRNLKISVPIAPVFIDDNHIKYRDAVFYDDIIDLPSVTPSYSSIKTELKPCEDAINRADVLALAEKGTLVSNGNYKSVCKAINDLPSVTPKGVTITDFADKCRECGRIKRCEDCISREAVMKCFKKWQPYMATRLLDYEQELKELPSVTPTSDAKERDKE